MTYKIFFSHTEVDSNLATAITKNLTLAFDGKVQFYLAIDSMMGGDKWKEEIKTQLNECNAIMSLITTNSINKPWIYIEWSHFWMHDKTYYTLLSKGVDSSQIIPAMLDRNYVKLTDMESITMLLKKIYKESESDNTTFFSVKDQLILDIDTAIKEDQENIYGIFRNEEKALPDLDMDKIEVANYFYIIGEKQPFIRILKSIRSDFTKVDLLLSTIKDSRFSDVDENQICLEVSKTINRVSCLTDVVNELIEQGNIDSKELKEICHTIARKSQEELRLVIVTLIDTEKTENFLFESLLTKIKSNAQIRMLCSYIISVNKTETKYFESVFNKMINGAELKNLALELIDDDNRDTDLLEKIKAKILSRNAKSHHEFVIEYEKNKTKVV